MRGNIVGLLAVALMCVCGVAQPSIVYTVNITDGTETISGTITTDGTIGVLVAGDIIAWDLTAFGPQPFGPHLSATGAGVECGSSGCGVDATINALLFTGCDFCTDAFIAFSYTDSSGFGDLLVLSVSSVSVFPICPGEVCGGGYILRQIGPYTIGAVPEPGTITLLGLALAGLGFARKRSRGRQSTAV